MTTLLAIFLTLAYFVVGWFQARAAAFDTYPEHVGEDGELKVSGLGIPAFIICMFIWPVLALVDAVAEFLMAERKEPSIQFTLKRKKKK